MKNAFVKLALGALLGASSAVHAAPVTFEFNIPTWTQTDNSALFGTHGVLDVTIDNGSSSVLNQTYLNSEITKISLTTVGGTFSRSWIGADGTDLGTGAASASYISTDGSGTPTLDLLAAQNTIVYDFFDSQFRLQLGIIRPSGGFITFVIIDKTVNTPFALTSPVDPNVNESLGFSVIGEQINVPEPATLAILGVGLMGLGYMRRRRAI
jgi:hypothetical protein